MAMELKDLMLTGEAKEKADQRYKEKCLKRAPNKVVSAIDMAIKHDEMMRSYLQPMGVYGDALAAVLPTSAQTAAAISMGAYGDTLTAVERSCLQPMGAYGDTLTAVERSCLHSSLYAPMGLDWEREKEESKEIDGQRRIDSIPMMDFAGEHKRRNEQDVKNHLEAMRRFEAEKQAAQAQAEPLADAGAVGKWTKPDNEKEFNLKLAALRRWMTSKGLEQDGDKPINLRHCPKFKGYKKDDAYNELCGFDNAFLIERSTFGDFWKEQKLLKFK